jgi:hypothetical protein
VATEQAPGGHEFASQDPALLDREASVLGARRREYAASAIPPPLRAVEIDRRESKASAEPQPGHPDIVTFTELQCPGVRLAARPSTKTYVQVVTLVAQ